MFWKIIFFDLIICFSDEIAEKLNEDASRLVATELGPLASKPMRSFLVASQLFIGLVYVHERQVKFLYGRSGSLTDWKTIDSSNTIIDCRLRLLLHDSNQFFD